MKEADDEVKAVLGNVLEYATEISQKMEQISEEVRTCSNLTIIPEIVEGYCTVVGVLKQTKEIHGIDIELNDFKELVADISEAMENKDYNLVADIFCYDFLDMAKEWKESLGELIV